MFREGKASVKSHMKNLIEMAMADGHFDDIEYDLLLNIAKKYNISESEIKKIRENPFKIKFVIPEDSKEKFEHMYDLVHMMIIDNYIDSNEIKLCTLFARKFGYQPIKINELVESMVGNIKAHNSASETYDRVKHLLN
jgi:uncharacterized tellurite resistance protein B-like protein